MGFILFTRAIYFFQKATYGHEGSPFQSFSRDWDWPPRNSLRYRFSWTSGVIFLLVLSRECGTNPYNPSPMASFKGVTWFIPNALAIPY